MTGDILRLLARINRGGHRDVSLAALSVLAHRSRHALHRGFLRTVGETPKGYTSRVRLSRAAAELLSTDLLTSAVADRHGFASHEVFTRAFVRRFGVSPRVYRARGLHVRDEPTARAHAAVVASVAPCVGLYRMPTTERSTPVSAEVAVQEMPEVVALVMRRRITREEIAGTLAEFLPTVFAYAQQHGLAMTGPPFARYPEVGMGSLVIEAGVSIAAPPPGPVDAGIEVLTIPAGPAAVSIHHGPYEQLLDTYRAMEAWIEGEGRSVAGPPWETYLTDPGEHPDPATWQTRIVQPIR